MTTQLRDYQLKMLQDLSRAWKRNRSVMVQMPTGTGKTVLLAEVIRDQLKMDNGQSRSGCAQILVVAHRRELLEQIRHTLAAFGLSEKDVRVESIQRLSKHVDETDFHPSLVVVDEAHHALANTYRMLWDRWPDARFLGLTATPCRLNHAPFTDLFQKLLQSWSIQKFIDEGWLSDFEYVSAAPGSESLRRIASLTKRGADGDFQTKEMATVMDVPASIEHLYKTYRHFADGKKGIVYAIDRQHAAHIADYYQEHGVKCAVIDAKTPEENRRALVAAYREGGLSVLVNVDIFSEGFDCPEVELIQLARPTLSLSKYLQQVGRGMRISKDKGYVLILDNVGLYQTFGLPTEERDWRRLFYGEGRPGASSGKGAQRYVVLDDDRQEKELVNLEMVRIKKGGRRGAGLEIILKEGRYGICNNGHVTCPARFKEIVRLKDTSGYYAAGIYNGNLSGQYVEFASLIDRKGVDLGLKLFRDVVWKDGYFYSSYKPRGYRQGDRFWYVYWDPKGNCYYDEDPEFRVTAGVEVAYAYAHFNPDDFCLKLRCSTGKVSPRFRPQEIFYNRHIIVANNYLIVKKDHNHAYAICAYLEDSVLVRSEDRTGFQQIMGNGKKGTFYYHLPQGASRILDQRSLGVNRFAE